MLLVTQQFSTPIRREILSEPCRKERSCCLCVPLIADWRASFLNPNRLPIANRSSHQRASQPPIVGMKLLARKQFIYKYLLVHPPLTVFAMDKIKITAYKLKRLKNVNHCSTMKTKFTWGNENVSIGNSSELLAQLVRASLSGLCRVKRAGFEPPSLSLYFICTSRTSAY